MRYELCSLAVSAALVLQGSIGAVAFPINATPEGTVYEDPGITDDEILIGMFAPLSGPATAYGADNIRVHQAFFEKINEAGGIWGRKLRVIVEDDKCSANDVVGAVKKLVEQDKVFLINGGSCSAATVAAQEYIEREGVPLVVMNASADAMIFPPSRYITASYGLSQRGVGGTMVDFATKHLDAKKIAYLRHDDAYGEWNTEAAQLTAENLGVEIAALESMSPEITDVTAPMLKVRAAQPDVLLVTTYQRAASLIIKKAYELGIDVPIVLAAQGAADLNALVENVGEKEAFANVYYQETINDVPGGPKQQWILDLYNEAYPDLASQPGHPTTYFSNSVGSILTVVYGLMMAGPVPTREDFLRATETMWFKTGSSAGPIEIGPKDREGHSSATFLKFDGETRTATPGYYTSQWVYQE